MRGLSDWTDDVGSCVKRDVDYASDMFSKGEKMFNEAKDKSLKVISERVNVSSRSGEINGLIVKDRV